MNSHHFPSRIYDIPDSPSRTVTPFSPYRRYTRWIIHAVYIICATCVFAAFGEGNQSAFAQKDVAVSATAVRDAIQDGVRFLKNQQQEDGTWGDYAQFRGGMTSLAMHALLTAGESIDDPKIAKGVETVRQIPLEYTYVVSLQLMVLSRVGLPSDQAKITECVRWLERAQGPSGGWSYQSGGDAFDLSNTQFAVLGLYEAERYGVPVNLQTWQRVFALLRTLQNQDGSWGYSQGNRNATGSMTCAGIGGVMMALDSAATPNARTHGNNIECCLENPIGDDILAKGLQWIGRNFSASQNPGSGNTNRLYYLYGIERIGRLTGNRFFVGEAPKGGPAAKYDWYREGCHTILTWKGNTSDHWSNLTGSGEDNPIIATSYALLFLSKGRMPILFSVLDASPSQDAAAGGFAGGGNWNPHRSAFRNLTDYVGKQWKMELTYQTIPFDRATSDDLAASQVLYLGGRQPLYPNDPATRQRLAQLTRDYLEHGGFLFAAADDPTFDADFRQWIKLVFPEPEYELKLLPASHPVWRNEEILAAGQARKVYGVEFGCRTSVIYVPCTPEKPLSCLWELSPSRRNRLAAQPTYTKSVMAQIQGGLTLGINVLAYATNRRVQGKEEFFDRENAENTRDTMARGRLSIASILHGGGCHAAPRALANLLDEAAARLKYRIDTETVELSANDPKIFRYPILFIHGRSDFTFTDAEREALRTYLERGGTIFADSVCGNEAFSKSFRDEIAKILPESPLERIPSESPVWTTQFGGFDLAQVTRREVVGTKPDETLDIREKVGSPELEGIAIDGKYRLFFSPYDLSCALEKADSIDCHGYLRDDAAKIALNLVLYGLQM